MHTCCILPVCPHHGGSNADSTKLQVNILPLPCGRAACQERRARNIEHIIAASLTLVGPPISCKSRRNSEWNAARLHLAAPIGPQESHCPLRRWSFSAATHRTTCAVRATGSPTNAKSDNLTAA